MKKSVMILTLLLLAAGSASAFWNTHVYRLTDNSIPNLLVTTGDDDDYDPVPVPLPPDKAPGNGGNG